MLAERAVQLLQAPDAQLGVGGPVGRVEGAAGRGDRGLGVGRRRVGRLVEDLTGRGIECGVGVLGGNEFSVDEQTLHADTARPPAVAALPWNRIPISLLRL